MPWRPEKSPGTVCITAHEAKKKSAHLEALISAHLQPSAQCQHSNCEDSMSRHLRGCQCHELGVTNWVLRLGHRAVFTAQKSGHFYLALTCSPRSGCPPAVFRIVRGPRSEERRGHGTRLYGHHTLRADQRTPVISDVRGECIQEIRIALDCLCIQGAETCRYRKDDSPQWP